MVVKKEHLIPFVVAFVGLCFSIYYESRSFVLGYIAAMIFLSTLNKSSYKTLYSGLMFLAFTVLCACLAFFVKTGSTNGRLLIYKISVDIFNEHYPVGLGIGDFKNQYLHYQAAYFQQGNYSEQELLLADNTYYVFNDYWQFFLEWGLFGGLMLLLAGSAIVYMIYCFHHSSTLYGITGGIACVFLIAISVAACFNHVFERFEVKITFVISILVIAWRYMSQRRINRILYIFLAFLSLFFVLFNAFGHRVLANEAYIQWREGEILRRMGYVTQGLQNYREAYPFLRSNGSFLSDYAKLLMSIQRYEEAIEKFEESLFHKVDHTTYVSLGFCYQETGKFNEAEKALLYAVYMVPNRFESRLALFDYYMETGQRKEAFIWGRSILDLPIKIPSRRVELIKQEVNQRIPYQNID